MIVKRLSGQDLIDLFHEMDRPESGKAIVGVWTMSQMNRGLLAARNGSSFDRYAADLSCLKRGLPIPRVVTHDDKTQDVSSAHYISRQLNRGRACLYVSQSAPALGHESDSRCSEWC